MKKRKKTAIDILTTREVPTAEYGTGEVATMLNLPVWRLQKFLDSPEYKLQPYGKLGTGRGSRRRFRDKDLYRLAIAGTLVDEGFAPWLVARVMEAIEDQDLKDVDRNGNTLYSTIILRRTKDAPEPDIVYSEDLKKLQLGALAYYVLPLRPIVQMVDEKIEEKRRDDAQAEERRE